MEARAEEEVEPEARDAVTNEVVWTRAFPVVPAYTVNLSQDELIFSSPVKSDEARTAVRTDAVLRGEMDTVHDKGAARVVEVLELRSGEVKQRAVIEVPRSYEGVSGVSSVGDQLYVYAADNRTVVYSLKTGQQVRQMFGEVIAADAESGRVCLANRRGEAVLYDSTGSEVKRLEMGSPLRFASLREGGTMLVVLTADQRVRRFAVGGAKPEVARVP